MSVEYPGNALFISQSAYDFVLYENGRAVYLRWEAGPPGGRRRVGRYYTARLSRSDMDRLRRRLDPAGIRSLDPSYDLLPMIADLGWTTVRFGPPWVDSERSVSVRGFLDPEEAARMKQPPPPAVLGRAYEAWRSARFPGEREWEPAELGVSLDTRPDEVSPTGPECVLPSEWLREVCRPSGWPGWSACAWIAEGRRLRAIQELIERCRSVSFRDTRVGLSIQLAMPHEDVLQQVSWKSRPD